MPNNKPKHNEEEPVEFKVVDRRMFTSDGEPRPGAEPEPVVETLVEPVVEPLATLQPAQSAPAPEPAKPKVDVPPPAQPFSAVAPPSAGQSMAAPPSLSDAPPAAATPSPGAPSAAPGGPVQFEHLIMSLVTQAMLQLGLAARPGDLAPKPDFAAAHETIDILGILHLKTQGNLTPHEDQLLSGSLQELRLAFVEISRRSAGRIN